MENDTATLNDNESKVLQLIGQEILDSTGGEFGFVSDIKTCGFTKHQLAGYTSQLTQKGMIYVDEEFGSVTLNQKGIKALTEQKAFTTQDIERFDS